MNSQRRANNLFFSIFHMQIRNRLSIHYLAAFLLSILLILTGCGDDDPPLENLQEALRHAPSYSILLENMKEEGDFFKTYYHKYRIVQDDKSRSTEWLKVPKEQYRLYEPFMGMVIAGREEGESLKDPAPPGYQYVGDTRYGRWRRDDRGRSFWEFYGKYAMLQNLFGGWYRPIYRDDYDAYRYSRSRGVPYFGRDQQFGTRGSVVKAAKPDFHARRMASEQRQKTSFLDKVGKRIGRSRNSLRSRAGGRGK